MTVFADTVKIAKIIKPLTDSQVKQAKPQDKPYKLADGGRLYLYVSKLGTKSWRMDYVRPIGKKRATITLGLYPDVSLAQAREQRKHIRIMLAEDVDPQQQKIDDEREQELLSNNTFAAIADDYMSRKRNVSPATIINNNRQLKRLNKYIGDMPITDIKPIDVLNACRTAEAQGYYETAIKMRTIASQVFRYGVQTAVCDRDVTQDLKGALKEPPTKLYSAIIDPVEFGHMLRSIDDYQGSFEVKCALRLMPMLFVRAGEMRYAKWSEFDLEKKTWTFTPRKTKRKTGVSLIVPLPEQAINILNELADHKRSEFVFPAIHTTVQPMSENTMNQALKRLGITGDTQTIHGFRASARTMISEQLKYDDKFIELQLGHRVPDMHGRAYNRAQFLDERKKMMQEFEEFIKGNFSMIVDTSSSDFLSFNHYMINDVVSSLILEYNKQYIIHCPITYGQNRDETISCLLRIIEDYPNTPIIIWENEFFGKNQNSFINASIFNNPNHIIGAIKLEGLYDNIEKQAFSKMLKKYMTFNEIHKHNAFNSVEKEILERIKRRIWRQLDSIFN
ncbi:MULTISPECIES: integrase arm-type DNA-binding domain-containing protein [unclassified Psychrobacter]|uniref:integrase arm-type DNA-binding domain-containing protein n=1 Tax=unclassified Psychrobacter TaxID=196806 RepID=UPI000A6310F1|nr:integrase arm-type DNA-binding domain-containing protein [Psychrobacter sp. P11F6]